MAGRILGRNDEMTHGVGKIVTDTLTTAETLVLETLVAHQLLGVRVSTFSNRLWVKHELETLSHRGLIKWEFDDNADFRVTPTAQLMLAPEAIKISETLGVWTTSPRMTAV